MNMPDKNAYKELEIPKYYFIGIGGCGMSSLAHILLDSGAFVAGSDLQKSVYTEELIKRGAVIFYSHSIDNISAIHPDVVIYSSAIGHDNPELAWARDKKIGIHRRGVFLSNLVNGLNPICVAGMHGKTTTSAMLAYALDRLGASLGHSIGWRVPQLEHHGRFNRDFLLNDSKSSRLYFTLETDESDGTFTNFSPLHSIILNIDRDHMDYFGNFEKLEEEFLKFIENTRGHVLYCADNKELANLVKSHNAPISYGLSESASYRLVKYRFNKGTGWEFEVSRCGKSLGVFNLQLLGIHNVLNATAVIAMLDLLGFEYREIVPVIASFEGVYRRQEELYNDGFLRIFDDYGHHPEEIRATIEAIKPLIENRLLVVFQPHRYTRTRDLLTQFGRCFVGASRIWVMDVYGAGEKPIPGVTGALIVEELEKNGFNAKFEPSEDAVVEQVMHELLTGDVALFCGAGGNVTQSAHKLSNVLKSKVYSSDF